MKRLIALAAASILALTAQAGAKTALWEKSGAWTVTGNTDTSSCHASATYDSGRTMTIVFMDNAASLAISGLNVTNGQTYPSIVKASTGASGVFDFVAVSNDMVIIAGLNEASIRALMNAQSIFIQGLGSFELTGSKKAMASAWACFQALNSI